MAALCLGWSYGGCRGSVLWQERGCTPRTPESAQQELTVWSVSPWGKLPALTQKLFSLALVLWASRGLRWHPSRGRGCLIFLHGRATDVQANAETSVLEIGELFHCVGLKLRFPLILRRRIEDFKTTTFWPPYTQATSYVQIYFKLFFIECNLLKPLPLQVKWTLQSDLTSRGCC